MDRAQARTGLEVLIVTGQSGSGKSTVVRALEDEGFYCVDNLPGALVEQLVDFVRQVDPIDQLALVLDVRGRDFFGQTAQICARLRPRLGRLRILFLQAQPEAMIRRYSTTRRLHPLDQGAGLRAALAQERALLTELGELADETWDTSLLTPHQLREQVVERFGRRGSGTLRLTLQSFGFKYGVPSEANLLFDVRFLPNPYFDPALRALSGLDAAVADAVLQGHDAQALLAHLVQLMTFLLPRYRAEGKRLLQLAIGCTGGRHRSVALVERLAQRLTSEAVGCSLRVHRVHRDVAQDRLLPVSGA